MHVSSKWDVRLVGFELMTLHRRICKDPSKKFCPSCGSPSLIRASVTTTGGATPTTQIHLKQNFQYRTRGTKYSIPDPKMGSAKGQKAGGTGLILREDQKEFMNGMRREDIRRQKEERQLERAAKAQAEGKGKGLGAWNDPDVSLAVPFVGNLTESDIFSCSGSLRSCPSACRARVDTRLEIICRK